jgi:DNA-binding response OmpR family regulator
MMSNNQPEQPTILVVDDEADVCQSIQVALEMQGYHVITAKNGRIAIERARKSPPDLVILDLMMPGLDGFSTHEALRALSSKTIPFLFITATSLRIRDPDLEGVPHTTLQKPLDFDDMLKRVRQLMDMTR